MTALQILGAILCALPFLALFAFAWREGGPLVAFGLYAFVAAVAGVLALGSFLMTGSLR